MTTRTIARTRELGFEAAKHQRDAWGAGWKRALVTNDTPLTSEEANRVLALIVNAAAGGSSQNGAGFFMSVEDATSRYRNPAAGRKTNPFLRGRTGEFKLDDDESDPQAKAPTKPGPGRAVRKQKIVIDSDADDLTSADEAREKPAPVPTPEPAPEPEPVPTLRKNQSDRFSALIRGRDGENDLSRFADLHLKGRLDKDGAPFTPERIAEKAREMIAPELPVESFEGPVHRALVVLAAMRGIESPTEEDADKPTPDPPEPGEDYAQQSESDLVGAGLGAARQRAPEAS